jgi:hypothetical protein
VGHKYIFSFLEDSEIIGIKPIYCTIEIEDSVFEKSNNNLTEAFTRAESHLPAFSLHRNQLHGHTTDSDLIIYKKEIILYDKNLKKEIVIPCCHKSDSFKYDLCSILGLILARKCVRENYLVIQSTGFKIGNNISLFVGGFGSGKTSLCAELIRNNAIAFGAEICIVCPRQIFVLGSLRLHFQKHIRGLNLNISPFSNVIHSDLLHVNFMNLCYISDSLEFDPCSEFRARQMLIAASWPIFSGGWFVGESSKSPFFLTKDDVVTYESIIANFDLTNSFYFSGSPKLLAKEIIRMGGTPK